MYQANYVFYIFLFYDVLSEVYEFFNVRRKIFEEVFDVDFLNICRIPRDAKVP